MIRAAARAQAVGHSSGRMPMLRLTRAIHTAGGKGTRWSFMAIATAL
jgi:hypothetical protein